jgi:hypothetical protein
MTKQLQHVMVLQEHVDVWRQAAGYPTGRVAIFFGVQTGLVFAEGLDAQDFDLYAVPQLANSILLFDKAQQARKTFQDLDPTWEIVK